MKSAINAADVGNLGGDTQRRQAGLYAMAIALAALAGLVDAAGFIRFHGLFVSVMSGNSTQAMVAAAGRNGGDFLMLARTILLFVGGVTTGEIIHAMGRRRGRTLVLAMVTVLVATALLMLRLGATDAWVASVLAFAMGIQNATVHTAEGISLALTYVTGTLVQVGRGLARAMRGDAAWHAPLPFLGLWLGFVIGGLAGALAVARSLDLALGVAFCVALALLVWSLVMREA